MIDVAPVALFVYNRPELTKRTLLSLSENLAARDTVLYVFSDGPKHNATKEEFKNIAEVRQLVKRNIFFKEIIIKESEINLGLARSVIGGVSDVLSRHDRVIVVEDDLLVSKGFLEYMNFALERYLQDEGVMQVSGHSFPAADITAGRSSYFIPMTTSWGWATWSRAWNKFDPQAVGYETLKSDREMESEFNLGGVYPYSSMLFAQMESNKLDSWAICWWWSVFKNKGVSLFPDKTLVRNIGFMTEAATHTKSNDPFPVSDFDAEYRITSFPDKININSEFFSKIKSYIYSSQRKAHYEKSTMIGRILRRLFN